MARWCTLPLAVRHRWIPLEPMSTDTIVDIGSTSKQFTATTIVLLQQKSKPNALDDTLATFLPDLPDWAADVTLRQMIHHTSGIPDYIALLLGEGFDYADVTTDADTLDVLGQVTELDFEPDDHFEYSNSNYFLLGEVVTAVTGESLGDFLAAEVFKPLRPRHGDGPDRRAAREGDLVPVGRRRVRLGRRRQPVGADRRRRHPDHTERARAAGPPSGGRRRSAGRT